MTWIGVVPRRCVNLPPGKLGILAGAIARGRLREGEQTLRFERELAAYLGTPHAIGAASGRTAFQLALEALDLPKGCEIVFPAFTFPVMPMVAKLLGYRPVFCDVDPRTFNAGVEEVLPVLSERTGAVLATHLFGRPCAIEALAKLARERGLRLLEDCAHALGVRVGGRAVGSFGDVGVFSFAEGKNMPCFGGGAIATSDAQVAERARAIAAAAPIPSSSALVKQAVEVLGLWLLTRPALFGLTVFPALRAKQMLGASLLDSEVGDELLASFSAAPPRVVRLANLQAALGLAQLRRLDAFNAGARRNGEVLTSELGELPGVEVPSAAGEHIYVYYPLRVEPARRDALRHHLLRHGIDAKLSDMADCRALTAFRGERGARAAVGPEPLEASVLEICVYPDISQARIRRVAQALRSFASRSADRARSAPAGKTRGSTA